MRSVVVTGTSTGIGWGTTKVLIARGFRVFGSVRKKADAERLSAEFGTAFVPLVFDVTDEDAVGSAAARVGDALAGEKLFGLVNMPASSSPGRCWSCRSASSASRSRSI
jgi:NAD(P)-dependent dehydrogenase (short-subunit alcohol dehydrogenase family)